MDKLEKTLEKFKEFDLTFTKKEKNIFLLDYHDLQFDLVHKKDKLYLKAKITGCPSKGREVLFSYLMRANLLAESTYGNSIGMDIEEKSLTLTGTVPYEASYELFKEKLELFLGAREIWEKEIKEFIQKAGI